MYIYSTHTYIWSYCSKILSRSLHWRRNKIIWVLNSFQLLCTCLVVCVWGGGGGCCCMCVACVGKRVRVCVCVSCVNTVMRGDAQKLTLPFDVVPTWNSRLFCIGNFFSREEDSKMNRHFLGEPSCRATARVNNIKPCVSLWHVRIFCVT